MRKEGDGGSEGGEGGIRKGEGGGIGRRDEKKGVGGWEKGGSRMGEEGWRREEGGGKRGEGLGGRRR